MVNMLCYVMTLTPTSKESWTRASGRWKGYDFSCNVSVQSLSSSSVDSFDVFAFLITQSCLFSSPLLSSPHRSECSNCEVGEQCGVLMHGRAVTFCEPFGERELVTAMFDHRATAVHFMAHWPYIQTSHSVATTTAKINHTLLALTTEGSHVKMPVFL